MSIPLTSQQLRDLAKTMDQIQTVTTEAHIVVDDDDYELAVWAHTDDDTSNFVVHVVETASEL